MSMMVNPARFGGGVITDPHFASVVLLMGFDGADGSTTMADEGPLAKGNASVNSNAQLDTAQSKFGTASALFDGNADQIYYADHADFELGAGAFTIEAWVRANSLASNRIPFAKGGSAGNQCYNVGIGATNITWVVSTNSGVSFNTTDINVAHGMSTATWYWVAISYNGTNKYRLRVDGVMVGSSTTARTLFNSAGVQSIGNIGNFSASVGWDGWIDEFRLTKGVDRYDTDSNIPVPTAAWPRS